MTPHDIQRALKLVALLLDGAEADPVFRADLPLAAAKIKYLARLLPDHSWARSDLISEVRLLKARWVKLYFGEEIASTQPSTELPTNVRSVDRRRGTSWTTEEEKRCLTLLDSDVGMFLFLTFGRVIAEARGEDGKWRIALSKELVFDAESLRGPGNTLHERARAIATEAVLIRAQTGLPRREIASLAEKIAPATFELFATDGEPGNVIENIADRLARENSLVEGPSGPEREVMFTLTPRGIERSRAALAAWQIARIVARGLKTSDQQIDDDIPF
jgi:hypothetical protein